MICRNGHVISAADVARDRKHPCRKCRSTYNYNSTKRWRAQHPTYARDWEKAKRAKLRAEKQRQAAGRPQ